jgi:hypothetical protein
MPPTDASPATVQRRQLVLLSILGVVLVGAVMYAMWPAAAPKGPASNAARDARRPQQPRATTGSRGSLEVRLDELKQPPPGSADAKRNPFRFYVPPPPPPPPRPIVPAAPPPLQPGQPGYVPPPPPPPPPIPLKCIGTAQQGTAKVAAIFVNSDGKGMPVFAHEGEMVLGQYRLVKIQVESVVMEYPDGRGRQTIPIRGQ